MKHRIHYRVLTALAAVGLITAIGSCIYYWSVADVVIVKYGTLPHEFRPLWEDKYRAIADPPNIPWPQTLTKRQERIINNFDVAWVATLTFARRYDVETHFPTFHTCAVMAYRSIEDEVDREAIRNGIRRCIGVTRSEPFPWEGAPGIGVRLQYQDEFCDLLINRKQRIINVYDEDTVTVLFIPETSEIFSLLRRLTWGMPENPLSE